MESGVEDCWLPKDGLDPLIVLALEGAAVGVEAVPWYDLTRGLGVVLKGLSELSGGLLVAICEAKADKGDGWGRGEGVP